MLFLYDRKLILHAFTIAACNGVVDKNRASRADGRAFESRLDLSLFFNSNIFYNRIQILIIVAKCFF